MPKKKTPSTTPTTSTSKTTRSELATTSEQVATEVVKKKRPANGRNSPVIGTNGELYVDENDKKQFISGTLSRLMEYYDVEPVKTDEAAKRRIGEYFTRCIQMGRRPLVEELALALGVTRQTLNRWELGELKTISSDIIKKAKEFIATFDAEAAAAGKINPVLYFFRAKNYYGMRDQQEVVITPNNPLGDAESAERIEQKYAESVIDTTGTIKEE